MNKLYMGVILLVLVNQIWASGTYETNRKSRNIFYKGLESYRDEDYEQSLEIFRQGALIARNKFIIASFYYNAGNSSFMLAEKSDNIPDKKAYLEQSITDYLRCIDFHPGFQSARHNGELAEKILGMLEKQEQKENEQNNPGNLDDVLNRQKSLKEKTEVNQVQPGTLAKQQQSITKDTDALKENSGKNKDELQKAVELQKQNEELLNNGEIVESLKTQDKIIKILENAGTQDNDSEGDKNYLEYIRKLEKEKDALSRLRQSGGIQEVERDW